MRVYADRDIMAPGMQGLYAMHVYALTAEKMHSKSDIAAELAWRDMRIEQLSMEIEHLQEQIRSRAKMF